MTAGRSWKWWVCGALLLATMLNYMDRQTLSLTATQLKADINLGDARYGSIERWFSYAFAAGGLFFGALADRFGPRRLYPFVLMAWSAAGLLSAVAAWPPAATALGGGVSPDRGAFLWLFGCRTALGFFEAGHWPCALITARNVLTADQRPFGNSILQSGASLGAMVTPLIVQGLRAVEAPWQAPFVVIGLFGLLWIPLWLRLVGPDSLDASPSRPPPPRLPVNPWLLAVQFALLMVVIISISLAWQFQRAWLPKYLKEFHHYTEDVNYFTMPYYAVADIGCLASGAIAFGLTGTGVRVRWARLYCFAGCASLIALSALLPAMGRGPWLFVILLAVGAGALGAHPLYYALVQELPGRYMGILSGILAASSWVAVGYMQGAMGTYIEQTGSYDVPLVVTGLAPVAGLLAMACWVAVAPRAAGK